MGPIRQWPGLTLVLANPWVPAVRPKWRASLAAGVLANTLKRVLDDSDPRATPRVKARGRRHEMKGKLEFHRTVSVKANPKFW